MEDWSFVAGISSGVIAKEADRVVAPALATCFAPVGMVSMIIVDEALRGRGLGHEMTNRVMDLITPDVWRLVATRDGLALYEKIGFRVIEEILKYQGQVRAVVSCESAQWATADDFEAIRALDIATTGMDRHTLYAALASEARFAVLRDRAAIVGFAAVREFGRGAVVGPVIARTLKDAQSLLSVVMTERAGQIVRVDASVKAGLGAWLADHGLVHEGGGWQMQKGELPVPPSSSHSIFALASQALG